MSAEDVFAVSRALWEDGDFPPEPFSQREAWIWLVSAAAWKACRVRGVKSSVALKRGEFVFAVRFLADKWQWSKSRVARFIGTLEKRDMIRDTQRDSEKVYLIKNYARFQQMTESERDTQRDSERDKVGTAAGQQRDKEKKEVPCSSSSSEKLSQDDDDARATLKRVCEILRVELQAKPERITWLRQVQEMIRDGLDPPRIIAASEIARAHGKINLAYIRAIAFNPPKPQQEQTNGQRKPTATDQHLAGIAMLVEDIRERRSAGQG